MVSSLPSPTLNGLLQGSALSCTQWVVLLQPAVAYLNQLRSAGRIADFTLPSGRASPTVLAFANDTGSYVQDSAVNGVALKAACDLAKWAGLPAQPRQTSNCCTSAGRCLACSTLLSTLTTL